MITPPIENNNRKRINWETVGPILAATLALGFYGGLLIWIDVQEGGGIAAIFQDKDKWLAKILMAIVRLVR